MDLGEKRWKTKGNCHTLKQVENPVTARSAEFWKPHIHHV